jgi:hypothetical protein
MARELVAVPPRLCEWCGKEYRRKRRGGKTRRMEDIGVFQKRKFCSVSCSVLKQHSVEPPTVAAARKRAYKLREEYCEACGVKIMLSVHHPDNNPKNNMGSNRQTLCLSCHSFWAAVRRRSPWPLPSRMIKLYVEP